MRVITNNAHRDIIDASQLTLKEREEFDYLDWAAIERGEESASFFRYRGRVYDLGEFMRTERDGDLKAWDGYAADSYFSAVVVRYVDDNEGVVVGLALS